MDKKALVELAKSFGRFLYFGILGLISTFIVDLIASGELNDVKVVVGGVAVNLSILILAGLTGLVKLIDRYRHVSENNDSNGIAPKFLQS